MAQAYPVMLRLEEKTVVVVGGGVATRKVTGLLDSGAAITVIAPVLDSLLEAMITDSEIQVYRTEYTPGLLAALRPVLVIAATNDPAVNRQVAAEARELSALVSVTDDGAEGDFETMAAVRRGRVTVGVSTGGTSPALAAYLRARFEASIGAEYATLADWLGEARPLVKETLDSQADRAALWWALLGSPVLELLSKGDESEARTLFDRTLMSFLNAERG